MLVKVLAQITDLQIN